jgi:hypothetical protein
VSCTTTVLIWLFAASVLEAARMSITESVTEIE